MALAIGARLGVYEVTARIGVGGMGEVYRARDTKLNRDVALKVLPDAFAGDAGRLARFTREAQTLASLNHPNIAHIHGLEEFTLAGSEDPALHPDGAPGLQPRGGSALVMELVEGEDLSQRIAHGALPLDDALPVAKQICDALEAAHDQGIIHRDLKPANIKVRPDGVVKVLDFGLAKALAPDGSSTAADAMNSPTLTSPAMTQAGVILGTAAYMSPEQARGRVVDRRADIWAFGVVLFEMLTGRRVFPGDDITDTIVSVVSKEPDWNALPAVPPALRRLLARCLKKDPKARLRDIGEARVQIEELLSGTPEEIANAAPSAAAALPVPVPRGTASRVLPWAAAGVMAVMLGIALWAPWRASSLLTTALQFTPFAFEPGGQLAPVWSPDGKAVAFAARQQSTDPYQVYVRNLDSPVASPITHLVADAIPIDWTTAGRIVFRSSQTPAGLWSVSPVGGEPEPLQAIDSPSSASVSQDGTALAWLHRGDDGTFGIWVSSPPGAAPKPYEPAPFASRDIVVNRPSVRFSPDGRQILLFRNAGHGEEAWLMPYPANAASPPHRILRDVPVFAGTPAFCWMPDNRHVVLSTTRTGAPAQLYLADTVSGAFAAFSSGTTAQMSPAVSPDGSRLVFLESETDYDVVSVDLTTAAVTPLIATRRSEQQPAWAAKEPTLVYVTDRSGSVEIWLHKIGQTDRPLVTARDFPPDTTQWFMAPVLSPDATRVIYSRVERGAGSIGLWMSAVAGGSPVRLVKDGTALEAPGSWSPDAKWFVYWNVHGGRVSLNNVKTTGQAEPEVLKADVTLGGSWVPLWSPSGEWILHNDGGAKLISPDAKTTRDLSATSAVAWAFSVNGQTLYGIRQVAADRLELFSMSVAGGSEKTIGFLGRQYLPANSENPTGRLTLTPDGKSLTYSTVKSTSNLWLGEGLKGITAR